MTTFINEREKRMGTGYLFLYAVSGLYDFISWTSLKDDDEVELLQALHFIQKIFA